MPNRLLRLLLVFVVVLAPGCAPAPRVAPLTALVGTPQQPLKIAGRLQQDLHLSGEIHIDADLLVAQGRRLVIGPGSRVRILGSDSTKIDPEYLDKGTEILVHGRLELAGEADAPIRLELDSATPAGENWAGIELTAGAGAQLRHVDIVGAEIALLAIDAQVELEQVNLLGARYGLLLQGDSRLDYRGGRISGGDAGLLCFDSASLNLEHLRIVDNAEEGLYLASGCRLTQSGLQIARNDLGLVAPAGQAEALAGALQDNRVDFHPLPALEGP